MVEQYVWQYIGLGVLGLLVFALAIRKYGQYQFDKARNAYAKVGAPPAPPQQQPQQQQQGYAQQNMQAQYQQRQGYGSFRNTNLFPNVLAHMDDSVEQPQAKFDALKNITDKLNQKTTQIFSETDQLIGIANEKIQQLEQTKQEMEQHAMNFDAQFTHLKYHLDLLKQIKEYYTQHREEGKKIYDEVQKEYKNPPQNKQNQGKGK